MVPPPQRYTNNNPSTAETGTAFGEAEKYSDSHFRVLYRYHQRLGWQPMFIEAICKLLTSLFTILFSMFILSCVAWEKIWHHQVSFFGDALHDTCMPESLWVRTMYAVFIIMWLIHLGQTVSWLSSINEIHDHWERKLSTLGEDVKWISWNSVTHTYANNDEALARYPNVDDYITSKVMRYDNYLIAMLSANVFGFDNSWFSFTRFVELNLWWAFRIAFFSMESGLTRDFLHTMNHAVYTRRLRVAFTIVGIVNAVIVIFASIASFVFFVYKNLGLYHKDPTKIGAYQFTPLARWKLRDFNELPHLFAERLEGAQAEVKDYLDDFGDERMNAVFKLGEFVFASLFTVSVILSLVHPTLMFAEGWSTLFVMGAFGALFMWCQGTTKDNKVRPDPEQRFNDLVSVLHYTPRCWETLSIRTKYMEIRSLFKLRLVVFVHEFWSLLTCPFLFLAWLPKRADTIVTFLRDHSKFVAGRGVLCTYAVFDERPQLHGSSTSLVSELSEAINMDRSTDLDASMTLKWNRSRAQFKKNFRTPLSQATPRRLDTHREEQDYSDDGSLSDSDTAKLIV